ncbi:MAG: PEP/pyruvate-binding domain-containing protein [Akkermansiaceae bacterium]
MNPLLFLLLFASLSAQSLPLIIEKDLGTDFQKLTLEGNSSPESNHLLHFSHDAQTWFPIANSRALPWQYLDPDSSALSRGFYRATQNPLASVSSHSSWKNVVTLPDDPFRSAPVLTGFGQTEIRWIKFSIILDNAPTVYFQNSNNYQFHFNFATEQLDPFSGISLNDFNATSLHPPGQEIVLGALLFSPSHQEFAFEFVGQDAYPPEMLRFLYQIADAAIERPDSWSAFYFPTFEQADNARKNSDYFESHRIKLGSIARWQNSDACYSSGWALGRLVLVPSEEIDEAFRSGILLPTDILITDGIPAEIPYVAGVISTTPGTPNSHVAILARSYGVPFVYLSNQDDVNDALALDGNNIILRAASEFSGECVVDVFEAEDVSPAYFSALLDLKSTPSLELLPRGEFGSYTMNVASAELANIAHIGGKAANFSLLRKTIPESSPQALAITFDLWEDYLTQSIGGTPLKTLIDNRLNSHTWPPNIAALDADLKAIRDLVKDEADFSASQKSAILSSLQSAGFDPFKKLRFRSSTNVEDSDQFVGAGLYDSYSGCLQDDLDGDDEGPSHCDATKENERGVFRALRKVYASFYNLNAYLERLRRDVDESQVGMAVLVHHSFPDETEAANGVISGRFQTSGQSSFLFSDIVTQLGANSVTNPDGKSIPEVVQSNCYKNTTGGDCSHFFQERSSLLPLGQFSVMGWEEEYGDLNSLALEIALAYQATTKLDRFELEFEFKKLTDNSLVIKQVRRIPEVEPSGSNIPALVNRPATLEVFQGEAADLFSNHNLKLRFATETASSFIEKERSQSFLTQSNWQHHDSGAVRRKSGSISSWHNAAFAIQDFFGSDYAVDSWTETNFKGGNSDLEFRFKMPSASTLSSQPIRIISDFRSEFHATFAAPQLTRSFRDGFTTTTSQFVVLTPSVTDQPLPPGSSLQTRNAQTRSGTMIEINFHWPPGPTGISAGYTAPLQKWELTTITGLTTSPIQLSGYFSQTYRPGHHNFSEEFLFEPRLEEDISQSTLDELEALDMKQFYLEFGGRTPTIKVIGFDNQVRDLN